MRPRERGGAVISRSGARSPKKVLRDRNNRVGNCATELTWISSSVTNYPVVRSVGGKREALEGRVSPESPGC